MNDDPDFPEEERIGRATERRRYLVGAAVTLALTLAAFWLVARSALDPLALRGTLAVLALAQIAAHFHFFLHIDLGRSHRDDLLLILFAALVILLMVAGSLWILFDQWLRMM